MTDDDPVLRNTIERLKYAHVVDDYYGSTHQKGSPMNYTNMAPDNWESGNNSWAPRGQQRKRNHAFLGVTSRNDTKRKKADMEIETFNKSTLR